MKGPHVYLIKSELDQRVIKRKTDSIIFHLDETGLLNSDNTHFDKQTRQFKLFDLGLKLHEKAFILNIKTLYSHNDYAESFVFELNMLQDSDESCVVVIPGECYKGPVDPTFSMLYEPNIINMNINMFPYIGVEHFILNKRSICITPEGTDVKSYEAFYFTDPLVVFLLNYRHKFETLRSDDISQSKEDPRIYLVKKSLVEDVRRIFKNAVFPNFKYKTDNHFTLTLKSPKNILNVQKNKFIMIMVQVEYMIISPQLLGYEADGIKLTF